MTDIQIRTTLLLYSVILNILILGFSAKDSKESETGTVVFNHVVQSVVIFGICAGLSMVCK